MIVEVFSVQRLLWWALGVLSFVYFARRSINPSLSDAWKSGELGTRERREFLMYLMEYKDTDLVYHRMFGRRILYSVLAVIGSGTAFTIYLRPEYAIWGRPLSAGFLLPLIAISVVLLGVLLVLGVDSAWVHRLQVMHFSGFEFASPEKAVRRLEKRSWTGPSVLAVITGLLVIGAALIF